MNVSLLRPFLSQKYPDLRLCLLVGPLESLGSATLACYLCVLIYFSIRSTHYIVTCHKSTLVCDQFLTNIRALYRKNIINKYF